ncbi:MAG: HlyD family efflux transporter periplasmic adaptor subunit [Gammaproteobacteria bacterium]
MGAEQGKTTAAAGNSAPGHGTGGPGRNPQATSQTAVPGNRADLTLTRFVQVTGAALSADSTKGAMAAVVNRVADILPADRVVLVNLRGRGRIEAVSGGGQVAQDSRFGYAVSTLVKRYRSHVKPFEVPDERGRKKPHTQIVEIQQSMEGTRIAWMPLRLSKSDKEPLFALWMERWGAKRQWRPEELELLNHLSVFFGNAISRRRGAIGRNRKRLIFSVVALTIIASLFIPIRNSTTAPLSVVPEQPTYVFAPLEGILKELKVRPGQMVSAGDILFSYDSRVLDKGLEESRRKVEVARAELERLEGASFRDPEAQARIPVQQLEVQRAEEDLAFYQYQRDRADVKATVDGMVVLDDPDALIGLPIEVGQMVMQLADPEQSKLRVYVPASDVGLVREGAEMEVRLDRSPLRSLPARVTRVGFDIVPSDEDVPSLLVDGRWATGVEGIRPGQRGSGKIFSEPRALGLQIFRKPLISLREITGL